MITAKDGAWHLGSDQYMEVFVLGETLKAGCGLGNYIIPFIRYNYLEPDAMSSPSN